MVRSKQAAAGGAARRVPRERVKKLRKTPDSVEKRLPKRFAQRAAPLWQKLRSSSKLSPRFLPASSILRLLRGVPGFRRGFRVQAAAVAALQVGCEAHLLTLLDDWGQCALHARRAVVQAADVKLVRFLRGQRS
ncbi:uncharacterized protein LOC134152839 [Rhea pennata]|uniref:uncharacterized protein LOC134152839 n=1 Tax=Rhea pennata TaxID=8795 RepID=UPI002E273861